MAAPLTKQLIGIEFLRQQFEDKGDMYYLRTLLLLRIESGHNGGNLPGDRQTLANIIGRSTKTVSKHLKALLRKVWIRKTPYGYQIVSAYKLSKVSDWNTYKFAVLDSAKIKGATVQELTAYLTEFILEEQHKRFCYAKWKEENDIAGKEEGKYYDSAGSRISQYKLKKKPSPSKVRRNVSCTLVGRLIQRSKATVCNLRKKAKNKNYSQPQRFNTGKSARHFCLRELDSSVKRGGGVHIIYKGLIYFSPTTVRTSIPELIVTRRVDSFIDNSRAAIINSIKIPESLRRTFIVV